MAARTQVLSCHVVRASEPDSGDPPDSAEEQPLPPLGFVLLPDGSRLACRRTHPGSSADVAGVPIVFLHGTSLDSSMWAHQMPAVLPTGRPVVLLEFRGHGASDAPSADHCNHEDAADALRALGIEQCVLAGLSLGGKAAIDVALHNPQLVRGLVLLSPGLSGQPTTVTGQLVPRLRRMPRAEAIRVWHDSALFYPGNTDPALSQLFHQSFAQYSWVHVFGNVRMLEPEGAKTAKDRLGEVACPTLVLNGVHDLDEFKEIGAVLKRGIPHARHEVLPGAGHMLNMERPDLVNRALEDFLVGLDACTACTQEFAPDAPARGRMHAG
mmetsp:Transcript_10377/g.30466  ORF Transcript_10377/g.30466 Transcript_10377/m.30466 type:complete len:325 (-) Transcript_10377:92-1066(-)